MTTQRRKSHGKFFSKVWILYGLLAAVLGIVQGFTSDRENESVAEKNKRKHTWRIVWGCYAILLFIILVIQLVILR